MLNRLKTIILKSGLVVVFATPGLTSCDQYLDIVPDGVATLEMAFKMRSQAIKYLASCYSYLGNTTPGTIGYSAFIGGDEMYVPLVSFNNNAWTYQNAYIALGYQNVTTPYDNDFPTLYQAFRYCNTLVDNINSVPDMEQWEKDMWAAEAKTLKAYYMFHAIRKWGPIPIIKENLDIDASLEEVRVYRDNIDSCYNYVLSLLDEAIPNLYDNEQSLEDLGRITRPVAAMLKAKVAVYAASPLFNNNPDQSSLVDKKGKQLFPSKTEEDAQARWTYAVEACQQAIEICAKAGKELYYYSGSFQGDSHITQELTLREMICESWNKETIWGNTQLYGNSSLFQRMVGIVNNVNYPDLYGLLGKELDAVPLKIADQFYTKHGVPVENDLERSSVDPCALRTVSESDDERWNLQQGYITAEFNFEREPRFYADLCFDGGYMLSSIANNQQPANIPVVQRNVNCNYVTGYSPKKIIKYSLVVNNSSSFSVTSYVYPTFRLADLYLLYAEAINEAEGPDGENSEDLFKYLNMIRSRAGIPDVKEAWDSYSNEPGKYNTKAGMRQIIQRERLIELAFESERFWDIRRWKTAPEEYDKGVTGWSVNKGTREKYYAINSIYETTFALKDYFWPFSTAILENNTNLVQNLGW